MFSLVDEVLKVCGFTQLVGDFHPITSLFIALLLCSLTYLALYPVYHKLFGKQLILAGKHCYVTGGSKGAGKALAIQLAKAGAHVTIIARKKADLDAAVVLIKKARSDPTTKVIAIPADVTNRQAAAQALLDAEKAIGLVPEFIFTCAGAAKPGLFKDQALSEFDDGMQLNFFGTLNTVHPAVRRMVEARVQGRVIMMASVLGLFGLVGYSQYSPTKHALRGLAEVLRGELLMYGIGVHIMFPGTILSEGLENENKTKPTITKQIEGADDGLTPDAIAKALLDGVRRNQFHITSDFIDEVARITAAGVSPWNNLVWDTFLALVGWTIFGPWRLFVDMAVRQHATSSSGPKSKSA